MIWAMLALLGIPLWLVLGGLAATLLSRRHFRSQDGIVPLLVREPGEDWPRRRSYGRYVHNVLIVHHGIAQVRTSVRVVEHVQPLDLGDATIEKLDDPVAFALELDDGSRYEIALDRAQNPVPVGPPT